MLMMTALATTAISIILMEMEVLVKCLQSEKLEWSRAGREARNPDSTEFVGEDFTPDNKV